MCKNKELWPEPNLYSIFFFLPSFILWIIYWWDKGEGHMILKWASISVSRRLEVTRANPVSRSQGLDHLNKTWKKVDRKLVIVLLGSTLILRICKKFKMTRKSCTFREYFFLVFPLWKKKGTYLTMTLNCIKGTSNQDGGVGGHTTSLHNQN